jgi:hypothetical protein
VRAAVESDLQETQQQGFSYLELGGWALGEEWRGTRAALEILVGSYALSHLWGGCMVLRRYGSAWLLLHAAPYRRPRLQNWRTGIAAL